MKKFIKVSFILSFFFIVTHYTYAAELEHFTGVKENPQSCVYTGKVKINGISAVDNEDELGVFALDNSGNEFLVGSCVLGQVLDGYYYVNVYGDDPTSDIKDGAADQETLFLKVWDKSENKEYSIGDNVEYEVFTGLTEPSIPPKWSNAISFGLLNVEAKNLKTYGLIDVINLLKVLSNVPN